MWSVLGLPASWMLVAVGGSAAVLLLMVALVCLPAVCRKASPKEELFGVEGKMTLTNPDAPLVIAGQSQAIPKENGAAPVHLDHADDNDRASTLQRQLPDIPSDLDDDSIGNRCNSVTTGSEVYATVEEKAPDSIAGKKKVSPNKKRPAPEIPALAINRSTAMVPEPTPSSDSEPDGRVEVKNHQYARVKKENPYAKVQGHESIDADETDTDNYDVPHIRPVRNRGESLPSPSTSQLDPPHPSPPPRGALQRSSHPSVIPPHKPSPASSGSPSPMRISSPSPSNQEEREGTPTPGSGVILAASAIAGRLPANPELPYMTPPLLVLQQQARDAADGGRGGQHVNEERGGGQRQRRESTTREGREGSSSRGQPPQIHFSGDSQDSKGYTSISVREPLATLKARAAAVQHAKFPSEVSDPHYATVSDDSEEMYAAIEDPNSTYTTNSEVYMQIDPATDEYETPPAPPSVDSLKHVAQAHSRQASSSSSVASPKPEKRVSNWQLTPVLAPSSSSSSSTSEGGSDVYASVNTSAKKSGQCPSLEVPAPKSIEDMYAKVTKKKSLQLTRDSNAPEPGPSWLELNGGGKHVWEERRRSKTEINFSEFEVVRDPPPTTPGVKYDSHDSSSVSSKKHDVYDASSSAGSGKKYDPYESLSSGKNYQYESGPPGGKFDPYETVPSGPEYEPRAKKYVDPGYETLQDGVSQGDNESEPGYESVHQEEDAGYEEVGLATLEDPTYETLQSQFRYEEEEPNYESVLDSEYPPYERLPDSGDSETLPGYERVKHVDGDDCNSMGGYETISEEPPPPPPPPYVDSPPPSSQVVYAQVNKGGKKRRAPKAPPGAEAGTDLLTEKVPNSSSSEHERERKHSESKVVGLEFL